MTTAFLERDLYSSDKPDIGSFTLQALRVVAARHAVQVACIVRDIDRSRFYRKWPRSS